MRGIRARDVAVRLGTVDVLHGIDLDLAPGEVLGLIGPNGSGKTTLLRALYRSLRVQGEIDVDGDLLGDCPPTEVARRIGVVPQESTGEVVLTVEQMVLLGRTPHLRGWQGYRDSDRILAEQELIGTVYGVSVDVVDSGGVRQLVLGPPHPSTATGERRTLSA